METKMRQEDIEEILDLFYNCSDLKENEDSKILSAALLEHENTLEKLGIRYEKQKEGILIELLKQDFLLYKDKKSCLKYFEPPTHPKDILIIKDKEFYSVQELDSFQSVFFENIIYFYKIFELISNLNNEVISYLNTTKKEMILLSEKMGKFEVGYKNRTLDFFNGAHQLQTAYNTIKQKIENKEYASFFKNNIIKTIKDESDVDNRFLILLERLENIIQNTNREFELFKHKFSFDEFNSKFIEEKYKYFKNVQDVLSDMHSKINTLPIQFGVYIFLIFRFETNPFPLAISFIIVLIWSILSYNTALSVKKFITFLKQRFDENYNIIKEKSGLKEEDIRNEKEKLNERIENIFCLIKWYRIAIVTFGLFCMFLCGYFIIDRIAIRDILQILLFCQG